MNRIISASFIILLIIIPFSGCLKTPEDTTQVKVAKMELAADRIRTSYIDFNLTIYLTNYGSTNSVNTSLVIKTFDDDTGLRETYSRIFIGRIDSGKTRFVSTNLSLPRKGDHTINVEAYEGESYKSSSTRTIFNLDALQPQIKDIDIDMGEMDFLVRNVSGHKVTIESDIYFTNEGSAPSKAYDVQVKARERDAGLIADKEWIRLPSIPSEKTVVRSTNLTVPEGYNYLVEVTIWSNGTIARKSQGLVVLRMDTTLSKDERVVSRTVESSAFKVEEAAEAAPEPMAAYPEAESSRSMPGMGVFAAIASVLAVLVLGRWRR